MANNFENEISNDVLNDGELLQKHIELSHSPNNVSKKLSDPVIDSLLEGDFRDKLLDNEITSYLKTVALPQKKLSKHGIAGRLISPVFWKFLL